MNRASTRGSGGTKSALASASVGRATAGRALAGAPCWPDAAPVTIALAAPAAPAAAPFRNLRRSTELVDALSTGLATASPIDYCSAGCVPASSLGDDPATGLVGAQLVMRTRLRPAVFDSISA